MAGAAGTESALRVYLEAPDAGRLAALEAFVRIMLEPAAPRPPR